MTHAAQQNDKASIPKASSLQNVRKSGLVLQEKKVCLGRRWPVHYLALTDDALYSYKEADANGDHQPSAMMRLDDVEEIRTKTKRRLFQQPAYQIRLQMNLGVVKFRVSDVDEMAEWGRELNDAKLLRNNSNNNAANHNAVPTLPNAQEMINPDEEDGHPKPAVAADAEDESARTKFERDTRRCGYFSAQTVRIGASAESVNGNAMEEFTDWNLEEALQELENAIADYSDNETTLALDAKPVDFIHRQNQQGNEGEEKVERVEAELNQVDNEGQQDAGYVKRMVRFFCTTFGSPVDPPAVTTEAAATKENGEEANGF